jgi:hypothetical protein
MKRNLTKSFVLLFVGALLGGCLVASLNAAQESWLTTGYAFWNKLDDNAKLAYLLGYFHAERFYRFALDNGAKPRCTDEGKAWIEDFDRKILTSDNLSLKQAVDGINEFYKNWKNQSVYLNFAINIVKMQIAGRSQPEIEEAIRKARSASNK